MRHCNAVQISKVPSLGKSHQNTHNSAKYEEPIKQYLRSILDISGKERSFCPCFVTHELKPAEFYAACCGDKINRIFSQTRAFHTHTRKTVTTIYPSSCPHNAYVVLFADLKNNQGVTLFNNFVTSLT